MNAGTCGVAPYSEPSGHGQRVHIPCGLSDERLAHMVAQRAFVEMKAVFLRAASDIPGITGQTLQQQVRNAHQAIELWRLREHLFAALPVDDHRADDHRLELHRQLDTVFPDLSDGLRHATRG